jgi:hypothetical protein
MEGRRLPPHLSWAIVELSKLIGDAPEQSPAQGLLDRIAGWCSILHTTMSATGARRQQRDQNWEAIRAAMCERDPSLSRHSTDSEVRRRVVNVISGAPRGAKW